MGPGMGEARDDVTVDIDANLLMCRLFGKVVLRETWGPN